MRRLIHATTKIAAALLVSILLFLCATGVAAHASNSNQSKASSCSASCHAHGQATIIGAHEDQEEDNKKEPTPPLWSWFQAPINLALLYVAPVFGVLWFVSNKRKILLTTQLRF
jgi:hypothetical protein